MTIPAPDHKEKHFQSSRKDHMCILTLAGVVLGIVLFLAFFLTATDWAPRARTSRIDALHRGRRSHPRTWTTRPIC